MLEGSSCAQRYKSACIVYVCNVLLIVSLLYVAFTCVRLCVSVNSATKNERKQFHTSCTPLVRHTHTQMVGISKYT